MKSDAMIELEKENQIVSEEIRRAIDRLDFGEIHRLYWAQNECLFLQHFLPPEMADRYLIPEVDRVRPDVHRNYIPRHKKGGSVSYYVLREKAPGFLELYRSRSFIEFLNRVVGARVMTCPENDPHACALYFYTEPGDHIGFHYDTSFYKGARYTVLLGLVQRSGQCKLVCQLYKGDPKREMKELVLTTNPGSLVIFNGDKLWHAVTPLGEGEERVMLTLE